MSLSRSLLFVPGNREDLLNKIERFEADAYILDLEDGVPAAEKENARRTIARLAPGHHKAGRTLHIRVNPVHTPWHRDDLEAALDAGITRIHIPKLASEDDLRAVDHRLVELTARWGFRLDELELYPTIETSRAVLDADRLCSASARVTGVLVGGDDLTAEWGVERTPRGEEIDWVRSQIVVVACAYGASPIDATYPFHRDLEGCERDARRARALGFRGKQAIHPAQCPIFNRAFTPTAEEVDRARAIVQAADEARQHGHGTAAARDTQIDAAVEKSARRLLTWAERCQEGTGTAGEPD